MTGIKRLIGNKTEILVVIAYHLLDFQCLTIVMNADLGRSVHLALVFEEIAAVSRGSLAKRLFIRQLETIFGDVVMIDTEFVVLLDREK